MNELGLLVIDDHPVYRDALSEKLRQKFELRGVRVHAVGTAGEGLDKVQADSSARWVVVLDVLMPGLSGLAGIKAFKAQERVEHVVSISGLDEKVWEARTVAAGASLFISKTGTSESIARKLSPLLQIDAAARDLPEPVQFRLTSRQMEVLMLIGRGHPNKIIADELRISEQTVKIHVNQIFKEMRVYNRTQAVLMAQKHQLL